MSIYSKVKKLQVLRVKLAKISDMKRGLTMEIDGAKTEIMNEMIKNHDQKKVEYGDMYLRRAIKKTIQIVDVKKIFGLVAESEKKNFLKYDTEKMKAMVDGIITVEHRIPDGAEIKETEYLAVKEKKEKQDDSNNS